MRPRPRRGLLDAKPVSTPAQTLLAPGPIHRALSVVVQGSLIPTRDGVKLAEFGPGDHFGELALVDAQPRSATVTATGFGSLISIDRAALDEFSQREPELGIRILWKLLGTVAQRLRETNTKVVEKKH